METSACPSRSETTFGSTPESSSHVACVCRREWNVTPGPTPSSRQSDVNSALTASGSSHLPSHVTSGERGPSAGATVSDHSKCLRTPSATSGARLTLRSRPPLVLSCRTATPRTLTTVAPTWSEERKSCASRRASPQHSPHRRPVLSASHAAKEHALCLAGAPSSNASTARRAATSRMPAWSRATASCLFGEGFAATETGLVSAMPRFTKCRHAPLRNQCSPMTVLVESGPDPPRGPSVVSVR